MPVSFGIWSDDQNPPFFLYIKLYACEEDFIFLRICCGKVSGGLNAGFEQFLTDRNGQIGRTIDILLGWACMASEWLQVNGCK
ncbi:MAG: hypothetical protein LUF04_10615 [Bacteroides sp.]|nr:hypothetical protein [Bacteroides sp.]